MIINSPLKWVGSKRSSMPILNPRLPDGERLVEPFVGSGTVFLNTNYPRYLLADINPDLINFFTELKVNPERTIHEARRLFTPEYNNEGAYYSNRKLFNTTDIPELKAVLFLYLNRHGFNGLCRYNLSGAFNVAFGKYKKPYFPEEELWNFSEKSKSAIFLCCKFQDVLTMVRDGDVIYADPPYSKLQGKKSFTSYHGGEFTEQHQEILLSTLQRTLQPFLINNHDTPYTKKLYGSLNRIAYPVSRTVSRDGDSRNPTMEVLVSNRPITEI